MGFRVGVWGVGFGARGLGFRVWGVGCGVWGVGCGGLILGSGADLRDQRVAEGDGTSLIRNSDPLGSCSRTMPMALCMSWGRGMFLIEREQVTSGTSAMRRATVYLYVTSVRSWS